MWLAINGGLQTTVGLQLNKYSVKAFKSWFVKYGFVDTFREARQHGKSWLQEATSSTLS